MSEKCFQTAETNGNHNLGKIWRGHLPLSSQSLHGQGLILKTFDVNRALSNWGDWQWTAISVFKLISQLDPKQCISRAESSRHFLVAPLRHVLWYQTLLINSYMSILCVITQVIRLPPIPSSTFFFPNLIYDVSRLLCYYIYIWIVNHGATPLPNLRVFLEGIFIKYFIMKHPNHIF